MPEEEEKKRPEPLREQLRRLAGEVEHLRHDLGIDLEEIRSHIATLATRVEERIRPGEVAEIGQLVADMQMFLSGLMLPWRGEIEAAREEKELWRRRIQRGETELANEIVGKYAIYRSYHHLPSCETHVETSPLT